MIQEFKRTRPAVRKAAPSMTVAKAHLAIIKPTHSKTSLIFTHASAIYTLPSNHPCEMHEKTCHTATEPLHTKSPQPHRWWSARPATGSAAYSAPTALICAQDRIVLNAINFAANKPQTGDEATMVHCREEGGMGCKADLLGTPRVRRRIHALGLA
jgi:hypothetical protein